MAEMSEAEKKAVRKMNAALNRHFVRIGLSGPRSFGHAHDWRLDADGNWVCSCGAQREGRWQQLQRRGAALAALREASDDD